MKIITNIALFVLLVSYSVTAQQHTFQDSLLDHMAGKWILQGTIAGKETTHDMIIEWVLGHQYVRLQEISREKNANGESAYEAIVFIGWDQSMNQYACLWLDVTGGGLRPSAIQSGAAMRLRSCLKAATAASSTQHSSMIAVLTLGNG
jgi:hypothetical protein